MCKCSSPVPVAITYHKERRLSQVTEIMCFRCKEITSVLNQRELNRSLERQDKIPTEVV